MSSVSWIPMNTVLVKNKGLTAWIRVLDKDTKEPIDVSGWTFYYDASSDYSSDTISLTSAGGDIVAANVNDGKANYIQITWAAADTAVAAGGYDQELTAVISSVPVCLARGTLTVLEEKAPAA